VQVQASNIQIDASKDRARLDARSNAAAERMKVAAAAEEKAKAVSIEKQFCTKDRDTVHDGVPCLVQ